MVFLANGKVKPSIIKNCIRIFSSFSEKRLFRKIYKNFSIKLLEEIKELLDKIYSNSWKISIEFKIGEQTD
jgi:hypothetical protein